MNERGYEIKCTVWPTRRQFVSKFRTDDAPATVSWIDRDADVHESAEQYAVNGEQSARSCRWVPRRDRLTAHCSPFTAHAKKGEAADPRNRLPPSQLVSPLRKGGQVRPASIFRTHVCRKHFGPHLGGQFRVQALACFCS